MIIFMKYFIFILFILSSCSGKKDIPDTNNVSEQNIYRYYIGSKDRFKIWIVDGAVIRKNIFNEFIYGGNDRRYTFVPEGEIWIDNSVSSEEYNTTLAHEINERNLMLYNSKSYFDAHDSSLAVELIMRRGFENECSKHETGLKTVSPTDFDSTQEIEDIPEMIKLKNVYRIPYGERSGIKIWIVDGFTVRRDVYPDFGFSGNDMAYHFIPPKEIWIDGEVSCEETEYSIALEMTERVLMESGKTYDEAYLEAVKVTDSMRKENEKKAKEQPPLKITQPLYRD
jgi:hypothetical protein